MTRAHAVLLAGGAGSRLGGADKALLRRKGRTLLDHWVSALADRELPSVVVGPGHLRAHLPGQFLLTREDPPRTGPAAAVCAGVRALNHSARPTSGEAVLLLSVDTVAPGPLLDWLLDWLPALSDTGEQAIIPRDGGETFQMLSSAVSRPWLGNRVERLAPGEETDQSLRWLLRPARTMHPVLPPDLAGDVDTEDDARRYDVHP